MTHLDTPLVSPVKLAMIVMDDREENGRYDLPVPSFGGAATPLLQAFQNMPGVETHIIACLRAPVQMPNQLAANVYYHGLLVPRWGFLRTAYWPCVAGIRRLIRTIRPHIVHGQGTERYAALAASFSGCTNLVTLHGIMNDAARVLRARPGSFYWLAARLETIALRRTSGVFCNSLYTQKTVTARTRRTWLVPNAVREVFLSQPRAERSAGISRLLHVGAVCENKQQLEVLEMARSLWRLRQTFQLQFIGSVDSGSVYGRTFLQRVRLAEAEGFARYLGSKSAEELVQCFDDAAALIHTPITETFGLVVAEALARNLKFFGFQVGGVPDIAAGANGAVLLPTNDWQELLQAVSDWLKAGCPAPAPNHENMRARYRPEVVAQRHLDIYQGMLLETPG